MAKTVKNTKPAATEVKKVQPEVKVVKPEVVSVRYSNKNLMISPRKLRLIVNRIKTLIPAVALTQLKFTNTKGARILARSVQNIIADAKNNFGLNTETLKFDTIRVDEGQKIKRMDKAHGSRFSRGLIQKRHSRLEIIVKGNK